MADQGEADDSAAAEGAETVDQEALLEAALLQVRGHKAGGKQAHYQHTRQGIESIGVGGEG